MIGPKWITNVPAGTARGPAKGRTMNDVLREARQQLIDAGVTVDSRQWLADIGRGNDD